ncbi:26S proteasome regulatory complex protein [Encephalitozoon hellem ATCC 50504]|uniref:26S proteasome regulatory subunit RPN1 n=1 Tax=Encephalitozoon hellem TaxID=27973 RepID=A0A9Q9C9H3_ENCHE|nr:26S proteasome regulatory complex protein [Encephalitozoon hellem ATCC 50504]AFM98076.1 26S proteasome regulatory complex protein [Encephalitozoon hellem ATCC 50504]UTX42917.1 26S proteasome regulatory subunit RPN1 [Encephalitozoon hellem]|eukprot:XP_003887057.1 26S proteasome regulatory complex protein [Encephalitozoon hellem ATCC 50504]
MEEDELKIIVERIRDSDVDIQNNALNMLFDITKSSHSKSIDTINFQYLADNLPVLEDICKEIVGDNRRRLCDIISAICVIDDEKKLLEYRVEGNIIDLKEWGHLYVKKLTGCIADTKVGKMDFPFERTKDVGRKCIDFLFKHNAEFEAIDFLIEIGGVEVVLDYVDTHNYNRIVLYLEDMASFVELSDVILGVYLKMNDHSRYVVGLIKRQRIGEAIEYVRGIEDKDYKEQCLYILARCDLYYETSDPNERYILSNGYVKDVYRSVGAELEIDKPSKIDGILKGFKYDKDTKQLASIAIANGFVHMGYGRDPMFLPQEGDPRVPLDYETILGCDVPDLISVFGSIGVIESWNSEKVMETLQEHIFADISHRKTGSLLGLALSGLKNFEERPAILALLSSNLQSTNTIHVIATLLGIESMFSGTRSEEVRDLLQPLMFSDSNEVVFFTAFTLGSVFCGSADEDLTSLMLQTFVEKEKESETQFFRFLMLGLACLFYRRKDVECGIMEIGGTLSKHESILIRGFQYVGTGDSNIIESILTDSFTGDTDALLESLGLLSCALVSIGDETSSQMVARIVSSSLLLDSSHLRSVLPLCYSLLYPSNPQVNVLDILEKSLNIGETNCIISTIISLGFIGAGTLNSRINKILDQQYSYYYKDSKVLPMLKIAQGLVSLGKGLLSISPLCFDKTAFMPKNIIGLFSTVFMLLDSSISPLVSSHTYMFFLLCQACTQKYVVCSEKINIRVGHPINTVGMVGEPKKLSSVQIHTSPVVLNEKTRAETDENVCTSYIEDVLIVKKN